MLLTKCGGHSESLESRVQRGSYTYKGDPACKMALAKDRRVRVSFRCPCIIPEEGNTDNFAGGPERSGWTETGSRYFQASVFRLSEGRSSQT